MALPTYTLVGEGRSRHSLVSVVDVAAFATVAVAHPAAINGYLVIGGPESLSWRDILATFERVAGQEIPVRIMLVHMERTKPSAPLIIGEIHQPTLGQTLLRSV